ncbi:primosomal protein N' [Pseudactinotalea suaedae]|uniref:primosomal protein N' n=1 Tax=Pseudactinotalea suaedae TaxID=1524924 RepID=UPI0012E1C292|nr:primosomal protein N' [Pseudactinotalea suaedae]
MAEQPSLLDPRSEPTRVSTWASVAQVLVDVPLPHLDRPFDYGIPESLEDQVRVGVRVKVRFAGRERDGWVIGRTAASTHHGDLAPVRRVVSTVPVLAPEVLRLARSVAQTYAGTTTDVLRLAIPPRHASAEAAVLAAEPEERTELHEGLFAESEHGGAWDAYPGGPAFLRRLATGSSPRAVWSALPAPEGGPQWPEAIVAAVRAVRSSGRGALVIVPDARDVVLMEQALLDAEVDHVVLTAEQGRSARYRRFLLALLGRVGVVVGTRSAALTPVRNLGLVVCWDEGDDLYAEPRAPYPHAREVLVMRAEQQGAAALLGGYARTPAAEQLVSDGWARSLVAPRDQVRTRTPRVVVPSDVDLAREGDAAAARFPRPAWELVRRALVSGPVLVQVPRAGYLPVVACARCRTPARCAHCHGPLGLPSGDAPPSCRWCGRRANGWHCQECGADRVRAVRFGSGRTAEELGRAFPGTPVTSSGRDGGVVDAVDGKPRLVVSTPGAEPIAEGGYAAAVLLDGAVMAAREDLDASVEALRRWFNAAALVRPDGEVMLLGQPPAAPAQALLRWDPVGYAQRELGERAELRFPPSARLASITGEWAAVRGLLQRAELPTAAEVLGPQPVLGEDGEERAHAIVRVPRADAAALSAALKAAAAVGSARKDPAARTQIDPSALTP